jgi:hypothetical protein
MGYKIRYIPIYIFRALFPRKMIVSKRKQAACSECGWTGDYLRAKHPCDTQLKTKKAIDKKGRIIDPKIIHIRRLNGGWVDLVYCPKCNKFIYTFYETAR